MNYPPNCLQRSPPAAVNIAVVYSFYMSLSLAMTICWVAGPFIGTAVCFLSTPSAAMSRWRTR